MIGSREFGRGRTVLSVAIPGVGTRSNRMDGGEAEMEVCGVEEYRDGRSVRPESVLSGEVVRSGAVLRLAGARVAVLALL